MENIPILQSYGQSLSRKKIILCFDGTGNKFSGTSADSNILKIYRMLDLSNGDAHYYQPGIGTYVTTSSLSHTTIPARINSWYQKAKDSAIGTSFDEHVMGGYKFLMRSYNPGDDIYFFGFSRGSYVARFLAEMLDHVGLLSAGNEEMARFAWKAFSQWQIRRDGTAEEAEKKEKMLNFLRNFRETFSRPVRRIRFLGLFDTVNSVPRFENAWMQRSKFPYTARSTAKIIRHAVSIDERRAKFRSDLIADNSRRAPQSHHDLLHIAESEKPAKTEDHLGVPSVTNGNAPRRKTPDRFRRLRRVRPSGELALGSNGIPNQDHGSIHSASSQHSQQSAPRLPEDDDELDEAALQDIEEVWFPGCHADIGGGWPLPKGETALSHGPLIWIVQEAQKAGLEWDQEQMQKLNCYNNNHDISPTNPTSTQAASDPKVPAIQITDSNKNGHPNTQSESAPQSPFFQILQSGATHGRLHDCLEFNNGSPRMSVISWRMMEYLPFRRMDLQVSGEWKSISWPLPKGEVRDMPEDACIHNSAIRRMKANENYRPGNLIIGGGGRGVRKAPKKDGIGEWEVLRGHGDLVNEVYVRKAPSPGAKAS